MTTLATINATFASYGLEARDLPDAIEASRDHVAQRLATNPFLTGIDDVDMPIIHTMTLLAMLGLSSLEFHRPNNSPCERSHWSKRYNLISAELHKRGVHRSIDLG